MEPLRICTLTKDATLSLTCSKNYVLYLKSQRPELLLPIIPSDLMLPSVMLAYRTSAHKTTHRSPPFQLMFGREVRLLVDIMFGSPEEAAKCSNQYVLELREKLRKMYHSVREHTDGEVKRQRNIYDRHSKAGTYQPGQLVWLHSPHVPRGRLYKLHRPWDELFIIKKKINDVVYRIQKKGTCKRVVVHFNMLKLYKMNLLTSNLPYQMNLPSTLPNDTNQEDLEELVVVTTEEPTPTPKVQRSTESDNQLTAMGTSYHIN